MDEGATYGGIVLQAILNSEKRLHRETITCVPSEHAHLCCSRDTRDRRSNDVKVVGRRLAGSSLTAASSREAIADA
eukprot:scaffold142280_cov32-Tisochrysis_lutea.AAC.1